MPQVLSSEATLNIDILFWWTFVHLPFVKSLKSPFSESKTDCKISAISMSMGSKLPNKLLKWYLGLSTHINCAWPDGCINYIDA